MYAPLRLPTRPCSFILSFVCLTSVNSCTWHCCGGWGCSCEDRKVRWSWFRLLSFVCLWLSLRLPVCTWLCVRLGVSICVFMCLSINVTAYICVSLCIWLHHLWNRGILLTVTQNFWKKKSDENDKDAFCKLVRCRSGCLSVLETKGIFDSLESVHLDSALLFSSESQ